jgi:hypothetical protein
LLLFVSLSPFSVDLVLPTLLDGSLHFGFASFLLLEQSSGFVFCFSHLFVEDFFLLVSDLHEFFNLTVDKLLSDSLLMLETFFFLSLFEVVKCFLFLAVFHDAAFFLLLFYSNLGLDS